MNLKIRKIKKESSSGISTKPKEKKQNIKLKVIKNVKPEKTERIYKTEVNADAKFGMNDKPSFRINRMIVFTHIH